MRKMKDSGVEWIGEIPKDWHITQTRRLFRNEKNIVGDAADEYDRLALTLKGVIKRSKNDSEGLQPEKFEGYQILRQPLCYCLKRNFRIWQQIDMSRTISFSENCLMIRI